MDHFFAQVMLATPPWSILTYSLPKAFPAEFWQIGMRVAVPLGTRALRAGIIASLTQESGLKSGIVCKNLTWPLETAPLLNAELLAMAQDLAMRQGLLPGFIWGHVLPKGLRSTASAIRSWLHGKPVEQPLATLTSLSKDEYACLAAKFLTGEAYLTPTGDKAAREYCHLRIDPPWPIRPAATKQKVLLDYLYENGIVPRKKLLLETKATNSTLQSVISAGFVEVRAEEDSEIENTALLPPREGRFKLNNEQENALEALLEALDSDRGECRLLFGVTGSGKTAVYMELAQRCLAGGKSVLLLAPEVALACKLARDVAAALPEAPCYLYHGYQTPEQRENLYRQIATCKSPGIVVGTRSALFVPLAKIGCIILDEEHDGSFKQDEIFGYHAKEAAWFRAHYDRALLVLGSATPDIKTFHAVETGKLPVLSLKNRFAGQSMPPVELVDIGASLGIAAMGSIAATAEGRGLLAAASENALKECMEKGEQAVIMLNRRGYAPMIYCLDCGKTLRCPHCEIGLSFHKGLGRLICHYCGFSMPYPAPCPECGKVNHLAIGEGTERLAERLEAMCGRSVLRLDRDSTRRPGRAQEILEAFAKGESPFLVGTQMLSKGHHFPNVTLVVVADGDVGLNLPDYRAAEKTFQLLVQAAGRAGRGHKAGRVLIQTRDLRHYCWKYVQHYDYAGFYEDELARRKRSHYPPFTHLAILRVSYEQNDARAPAQLEALAAAMRLWAAKMNAHLLGPAPAPIAMLRGRMRFQFFAKKPGLVYHSRNMPPGAKKYRRQLPASFSGS